MLSLLSFDYTWRDFSNTCISSLMVLLTFWVHAEDYEVANFCFSSDNIFVLHRCILHIPKYHQPPSDRHHYWSPILCPNNLTNHFDIHYQKSSPNHNLRSYVYMQLHLVLQQNVIFKCSTILMIMMWSRCYPFTPSLLQEDSINIISLREKYKWKKEKCVCAHAMLWATLQW